MFYVSVKTDDNYPGETFVNNLKNYFSIYNLLITIIFIYIFI